MFLLKPRKNLVEEDLEGLIENSVPEGKAIEYKLETYRPTDRDRKEFLFDVSSFANTSGGHLLLGVKEENGFPVELSGLSLDNPDKEILRLESTLRDNVDPRIVGIEVQAIPVKNVSGPLIVIRVPRSWNPPHMVTFKRTNKFYGRNSAGKYLLDTSEIRSLFVGSESLQESIRSFREKQVSRILSGQTPWKLETRPILILHVIPFLSLDPGTTVDLEGMKESDAPLNRQGALLNAFEYPSNYCRYNIEGLLAFFQDSQGKVVSYKQVRRDGIVEVVEPAPVGSSDRIMVPDNLRKDLLLELGKAKSLLAEIGMEDSPFAIGITLIGVKDYQPPKPVIPAPSKTEYGIDRDNLIFPLVVHGLGSESIDETLIPVWAALWNSLGLESPIQREQS